jgi:phosphate transport system substrate-binding protein
MLREELSKNRYGIAWTVMPQAKGVGGVKAIGVVPRGATAAVMPSRESFQDRSYPMVRNIYIYLNRKPGTAVEPKLGEFLRFILSREGQVIVDQNASYLPLTGALARDQLRKLD